MSACKLSFALCIIAALIFSGFSVAQDAPSKSADDIRKQIAGLEKALEEIKRNPEYI